MNGNAQKGMKKSVKKVLMKHVFAMLLTLFIIKSNAQIPVGTWRDHLPYGRCKKVVKIGTKFFVATAFNIFTYDTRDNSFQKLSRINGLLSDMGISTMEYNPDKNTLLIAYDNGNIDLLKNYKVTNIPIVKNQIMPGSKKANHILFRGNFAYISYSFGIVVLDLEKLEIKDTYLIGEAGSAYEVLALACDNQYFYAGTAKGLFKADINDPYLVDFAEWHRDVSIPNNTGKFNLLSSFNGKIFANYNGTTRDTLYYLDNDIWRKALIGQNQLKNEIRPSGNNLIICAFDSLFVLNSNLQLTTTINSYEFIYPRPQSALMDDDGNIWIADGQAGLIFNQSKTQNFRNYYPNGPHSQNVWNMLYQNGTIYVTGGAADGVWNHLYIFGQYYMFNNDNWTSVTNDNIWDFTAIAIDPSSSNKIYVGTVGNGVFVYENGQVTHNYTYNNSTLQSIVPNDNYVHIGGLIFDKDNNLWVTNAGDNIVSPISVLKPDGTWHKFSYGSDLSVKVISQIYIDTYGQFWLVLFHDGLFVFDINGTFDNQKDDRKIKFKPKTPPPFNVIVSNINCVTGDRDGNIWVGTDHGPILYSDPKHVLDSITNGTQVIIPRNDGSGKGDALLGTENVNCIAVDGGNRKWFGTEKGGAFLFSPDGLKELAHFNTDNSPIFSNNIRSIVINDRTGEVFFGTDRGIISYRGNSTAPNEDFTNVYVFPNPVRENYHGDIVITGLITDTHVKITDISGNLVYQTKSAGGQAIWNGKTGGGRRVATGVYLVFCSNDDGSKTIVTKILVIH